MVKNIMTWLAIIALIVITIVVWGVGFYIATLGFSSLAVGMIVIIGTIWWVVTSDG